MDHIRPVVWDDACGMIYAEIAVVCGISADSAERLGLHPMTGGMDAVVVAVEFGTWLAVVTILAINWNR